jgi:putative salt-induced outer membrane protein
MKKTLICAALFYTGHTLAQTPAGESIKPFTMDGEFGFIATTGNTETTSIKAKLAAQQELEQWSNDFLVEALYKKDDVTLGDGTTISQTTAQKYFLSGQANYKLANPDHRLFGFASYEDDRFSSFSYQSTVAAGWSQKLWDNETTKFEYSVGPGYSFAKITNGADANNFILRGALGFNWKISKTALFKQIMSSEVGKDNTKSKSETSVSAKINGSLSMKLSITFDHNSNVDKGTEKLDTQTAVTVVYTFF